MQKAQAQYTISKMQKDGAVSIFKADAALDIRNLRLLTNDTNGTLCLTNERNTTEIDLKDSDGNSVSIEGTVIGAKSIYDIGAIFTTTGEKDNIYVIYKENGEFKAYVLKDANLGFGTDYQLDIIILKETDVLYKVYFADNVHQMRVLTFIRSDSTLSASVSDFLPEIEVVPDGGEITWSFSKTNSGGASSSPGVIQYVLCFYNDNGTISPPIWTSPFVYTSDDDLGISPENSSYNTFTFTVNIPIDNTNGNYTMYRVYKVLITSENGTPEVGVISEGNLDSVKPLTVIFTDNGHYLETSSLDEITQLQRDPFSAKTITHKDLTLFAGNLRLLREDFTNDGLSRDNIKDKCTVEFISLDKSDGTATANSLNTQYVHPDNLNKTSVDITYFKRGETYRIGVQFYHNTGVWSTVVWLGDYECDIQMIPNRWEHKIETAAGININIPSDVIEEVKKYGYIGARAMVVYPNEEGRTIICQGLLQPTVYNLYYRLNDTIYCQSSWFARPFYYKDGGFDSVVNNSLAVVDSSDNIEYCTTTSDYSTGEAQGTAIWRRQNSYGQPMEYRMIDYENNKLVTLPDAKEYNSEFQYSGTMDGDGRAAITDSISTRQTSLGNNLINFGIDSRIVTMHSPELDSAYSEDLATLGGDDYTIKIVGYAPVKNTRSSLYLEVADGLLYWTNAGVYDYTLVDDSSYEADVSIFTTSLSAINLPWWVDAVYMDYNDDNTTRTKGSLAYLYASFPIYPWHRSGSLNNQGSTTTDSKPGRSRLEHKVLSNLRISLPTEYLDNPIDLPIEDLDVFNSNEVALTRLNLNNEQITYYGNVNETITLPSQLTTKPDDFNDDAVTIYSEFPVRMSTLFTSTDTNPGTQLIYDGVVYYGESLAMGEGLLSIDNLGRYYSTVEYNNRILYDVDSIESTDISTREIRDVRFSSNFLFANDDGDHISITANDRYAVEPVSMAYKSTSHAVFTLGTNSQGCTNTLPILNFRNDSDRDSDIENAWTYSYAYIGLCLQLTPNHNSLSRAYDADDTSADINTYYTVNIDGTGSSLTDNLKLYSILLGIAKLNLNTSLNEGTLGNLIQVVVRYPNSSVNYPFDIVIPNDDYASNERWINGTYASESPDKVVIGNNSDGTARVYQFINGNELLGSFEGTNFIADESLAEQESTLNTTGTNFYALGLTWNPPVEDTIGQNGDQRTLCGNIELTFIVEYVGIKTLMTVIVPMSLYTIDGNSRDGWGPRSGTNLGLSQYDVMYCVTSDNNYIGGTINKDALNFSVSYVADLTDEGELESTLSFTTGSSYNMIWQGANETFNGIATKKRNVYVDSNHPFSSGYISSWNSPGYYLIGELHRVNTNINLKFGGDSESALAANNWYPCGELTFFGSSGNISLIGDRGDTYYMMYDHIKTYPYTTEDTNSIVDIVSFGVETHINADGRYDRNRGLEDNTSSSPTNFNLYNPAYSQDYNNFTYYYSVIRDYLADCYPSQVVWSLTKTLAETIDTWTRITMGSTIDLDADLGDINTLRAYNNTIYALQDSGVSNILFNSRTAINTSDGVPIELANSGAVDGKVVLSYNYGCETFEKTIITPSGLYFIDSRTNNLLKIGEGITNTSVDANMKSWYFNNEVLGLQYDYTYGDMYSIYKEGEGSAFLAYSEVLGAFTSFYSYNNVRYILNIEGETLFVRKNFDETNGKTLLSPYTGDYDMEYSLSFISNPEFPIDKVFETVEFRTNDIEPITGFGNTSSGEVPFHTLTVSNEYQTGISTYRTLRKKFRVWRWQIGRSGMDRIRNPWAKVEMKGNIGKELRLYDIIMSYYK